MRTSAPSHGDPQAVVAGPCGRFPTSLILLLMVEAGLVLAFAAWMTVAIFALSPTAPTGGRIAFLLLMVAGVPLAIIGLVNRAARALWRRDRRSIAVAVAALPLLLMLGGLGAGITM